MHDSGPHLEGSGFCRNPPAGGVLGPHFRDVQYYRSITWQLHKQVYFFPVPWGGGTMVDGSSGGKTTFFTFWLRSWGRPSCEYSSPPACASAWCTCEHGEMLHLARTQRILMGQLRNFPPLDIYFVSSFMASWATESHPTVELIRPEFKIWAFCITKARDQVKPNSTVIIGTYRCH
jgi:hypothetical protein